MAELGVKLVEGSRGQEALSQKWGVQVTEGVLDSELCEKVAKFVDMLYDLYSKGQQDGPLEFGVLFSHKTNPRTSTAPDPDPVGFRLLVKLKSKKAV